MPRKPLPHQIAAFLITTALSLYVSHAAPRIVATIKPIHSLAASVLEGVTEPKLLLQGGASPHTYALKPSDVGTLAEADAIIRVSPNLEVFLGKALRTLPANARLISLERTPGLSLLPVRGEGDEDNDEHAPDENAFDVHFWLDPINAIAIAQHLGAQFSEIDPDHADSYQANVKKLETRLAALNDDLKARLSGLSGRPFLVFHDVTQYLEKRYSLSGLGAVTLSPERTPGAKRVAAVRAQIEAVKAICVFSEPEFPPKLVETLTIGTSAKRGILDEIGAGMVAGPGQYFALIEMDATNLASCLKSEAG